MADTTTNTLPTNAEREKQISDMYDAKLKADKASITSEYEQNKADAEYNKSLITPQYDETRNANSTSYMQNMRNNNMTGTDNGINSGTRAAQNQARTDNYITTQAKTSAEESEKLAEADRNLTSLKTDYDQQINEAASSADYNKASALLDEYNEQYNRQLTQASSLAQYGDFSGYATLYGTAVAENMKTTWSLQNPLLAYNLGYISADKYFGMTGQQPY